MCTRRRIEERAPQISLSRATRILLSTIRQIPPTIPKRTPRFVLKTRKLRPSMGIDPSRKKTGRFLLTKEISHAIV